MAVNLSVDDYANYENWKEFFPNGKVDLTKIKYHHSWKPMFEKLFSDKRLDKIQQILSDDVTSNEQIHPAPKLLFNAFLLTPLDKVKVVILGQDPYFDHAVHNGKNVHQAMGLSFSVPHEIDTPSSLQNIYKNQLKHGHIKNIPKHGNLEFWAIQGCLMLNSSLTVKDGKDNKNCHQNNWKWFTDAIIQYISDNCKNVIFVLWGADALSKMNLINLDDNEVIISSHPSGLSCAKPLGSHKPFDAVDHFGEINNFLEKKASRKIVWML